jgi:hypothetical protein
VLTAPASVPSIAKGDLALTMKLAGLNSEMKLEQFSMGANKLLMRLENIADTFDSDGKLIFREVNVVHLADELFRLSNQRASKGKTAIEEVSLTANQNYNEMSSSRLKWKTLDDKPVEPEAPESLEKTRFQQQRIRTFKIEYSDLDPEDAAAKYFAAIEKDT